MKIFDSYNATEVGSECSGFVARNICEYLKGNASGKKYLCVCVPCYNEDFWDFVKTLISLLENFEFMQTTVRNVESPDFVFAYLTTYILLHI